MPLVKWSLLGRLSTSTATNIVTFDLETGWRAAGTQNTVFDGHVDVNGKTTLEAAFAVRFQTDLAIYETMLLAPFTQLGPYLSIEATTVPEVLPSQSPALYFSKLEMGGKTGIGAEVGVCPSNMSCWMRMI